MLRALLCGIVTLIIGESFSQGIMRRTYHDKAQSIVKEMYEVKDTVQNILNGRYVSYFLNGNIESKGQFLNNETTGVWEFFYETGNLKMRGVLRQNSNYGLWEYFYENGKKSMQGTINGRDREGEWISYFENGKIKEIGSYNSNKRTGLWKTYFEDGITKGEIDYKDDYGRYIEYYHNGKVLAEGPRMGTRPVGHWRYYAEDGTLAMEGNYENSKKNGEWVTYYPAGQISSRGYYTNDEPTGKWEYYFDNGRLSASGSYIGGQKDGYWSAFADTGIKLSEANYDKGTGEYREYHRNGKLKSKGIIVNEQREGKWQYFFDDGKLEGECEFKNGKGTYRGFYPDGSLQTKGDIENDKRVGTWEIYNRDGTLSGYYKPFYDDDKINREIVQLTQQVNTKKVKRDRFNYFDPRSNEFRGVIVESNPVLMFAGQFPFGVEFYSQERLGHEFEFNGIRDPFFIRDDKIAKGKLFARGYEIAIKQKFYNPLNVGMWYFGHEIRFSNIGHFTNLSFSSNPDNLVTVGASEQRFEYGIVFGYRLMHRNNAAGFTINIFASGDVGYRSFDEGGSAVYFQSLNQSKLSTSVHVGLNLGHVFSAQ